jgi:hypothetical protein
MINLNIQKKFYQTTHSDDGVTQLVTDKVHTMYVLELTGNYFIEDAKEAVEQIITDLKNITQDLEKELDKHTSEERDR